MKLSNGNSYEIFHICKIKNKERFCLFMIIMVLGFITVLSCTAINADDADAKSFTVDEIKYRTITNSSVEVMGCGNIEELVIPSSITHSGKEYSVKSIYYAAFCKCKSIKSVTVPGSIKSISKCAFGWCDSLKSITLNSGTTSIRNQAFYKCTSLTSVTIPRSVSSINKDAFEGCTFYDSDGVTKIKNRSMLPGYIYSGESSSKLIKHKLYNVIFDENGGSVKIDWMDIKEGEKFTLPEYTGVKNGQVSAGWSYNNKLYQPGETMTKVNGDMKFTVIWSKFTADGIKYKIISNDTVTITGCDKSKSGNVEIPSSIKNDHIEFNVVSISKCAFEYCMSIKSISIPDSIHLIGEYAFVGCTSLESVKIGNNVTVISEGAFDDCMSLTSVTIPNSVISFGESVFYQCSSMTDITLSDKITSIGSYTFCGCASLISVKIPDSVTSIGEFAFAYCKNLYSIKISNNVTSIDRCAFLDCKAMTSVTIGDGVKSLSSSVFEGCKSLKYVIIPDSVESIGKNAFKGCTFYDSDGKTVIKDYSKLPGHRYSGESPSKLIRQCNVLFDANDSSAKTEGMYIWEEKKFWIATS